MSANRVTRDNDKRDFEGLLAASLKHWGTPTKEIEARIWRRVCNSAPSEKLPPRKAAVSRLVLAPMLALLVVIAFFGGYVGVVLAEGSSLPGEPFYKFERRAESLWLSLTPRTQRCEVRTVLLERRISELRAMLAVNKPLTPGLTQEIELLLQALGEEAPCSMEAMNLAHRQVTGYAEEITRLQQSYPGVWELRELRMTAVETEARLSDAVSPMIP